MARRKDGPRLRSWEVRDAEGVVHILKAHYCFNNDGEQGSGGLVLRRYHHDDTNDRTYVVASFAQGAWKYYKEIEDGDQE